MIQVESYGRDDVVQGAMSVGTLGQYLRSFMVKLLMVETSLGQLNLGGTLMSGISRLKFDSLGLNADHATFAIVIELKDDMAPSSKGSDCMRTYPSALCILKPVDLD